MYSIWYLGDIASFLLLPVHHLSLKYSLVQLSRLFYSYLTFSFVVFIVTYIHKKLRVSYGCTYKVSTGLPKGLRFLLRKSAVLKCYLEAKQSFMLKSGRMGDLGRMPFYPLGHLLKVPSTGFCKKTQKTSGCRGTEGKPKFLLYSKPSFLLEQLVASLTIQAIGRKILILCP